jgi:hypothetical protein
MGSQQRGTSTMPKSIAQRLALAAAAVGLLLGCGVQTDTETRTGAPATSEAAPTTSVQTQASAPAREDELRVAVQGYSDGFLGGNPTAAYQYFSARCKEKVSLSYFTGIVTAAKVTYGSVLPMASYDAQVSGDLARVTYTYDVVALNQDAEPWVREEGLWKTDDC